MKNNSNICGRKRSWPILSVYFQGLTENTKVPLSGYPDLGQRFESGTFHMRNENY
jgi:hypothetical protein